MYRQMWDEGFRPIQGHPGYPPCAYGSAGIQPEKGVSYLLFLLFFYMIVCGGLMILVYGLKDWMRDRL